MQQTASCSRSALVGHVCQFPRHRSLSLPLDHFCQYRSQLLMALLRCRWLSQLLGFSESLSSGAPLAISGLDVILGLLPLLCWSSNQCTRSSRLRSWPTALSSCPRKRRFMTDRHSPSTAAEDSTHWPNWWYSPTAGSSYGAHNPPKTSIELLANLRRGKSSSATGGARCWLAVDSRNWLHLDFVHLQKAAAVRYQSYVIVYSWQINHGGEIPEWSPLWRCQAIKLNFVFWMDYELCLLAFGQTDSARPAG